MNWQYTPYTFPLVLGAGALTLTALVYFWRRRQHRTAKVGLVLILASSVWMLGSGLELAAADLAGKIFWDKFQFLGIWVIPVAWLTMVWMHTGRNKKVTRRALILLCIFPIATVVMAFTNEAHGLIWTDMVLDSSGPYHVSYTSKGLWLWVFIIYTYTLIVLGIYLLIQTLVRSGRLYRWQATALLLAVLAPWIVNLLEELYSFVFLPSVELTPFALGVTIPVIIWGLFRLQLHDIVPVARATVVETMGDAVFVLSPENRILDLNTAGRQLLGVSNGRNIGQPIEEVWSAWPVELREAKNSRRLESELAVQQGSAQQTYDLRISPLADRQGNLISKVVVLRDITEIKQRTRELATLLAAIQAVSSTLDLDKVLNHIAEQIGQAIDVTSAYIEFYDKGTKVSTVVAEFLSTNASPKEKVSDLGESYINATFQDLDAGQIERMYLDDPALDESDRAHMLEYGAQSILVLPIQYKKQTIAIAELWESRFRRVFSAEEISFCQAIFQQTAVAIENARLYKQAQQEIAERRRTEKILARYNIDLQQSNQELQQFAYVASHDLQEPIRMVISYLQLLERRYTGKFGQDGDEYIQFAVEGATRMQSLINGLLAYSRIGSQEIPFELIDSQAALDQALSNLAFAIDRSRATITHDPLPEVRGDKTLFVQLFQNLISNAIKYKDDKDPQIHVGADPNPECTEWTFSIRDNGIGIDPDYFDRIFLIFQRLHTRDEVPGTGIGLAICKRIVDRHNGKIWVESRPKEGATFCFTIPVIGDKLNHDSR